MTLTRRAKALFGIIVTAIISFGVALPAFAEGEGSPEPARGPVDLLAILVTGAIILVLVIVLATVLSNWLGKRG